MPPKTAPAKNVVEQAEGIASDAWERTGKIATDTAKTVAQDVASQASWESWLGLEETLSDEAVKAKEDEEFLRKLDGYKEIFRKIDAIEGRVTDEKALDEKVRRYIEEEKKRAMESFREMKTEHKTGAARLGTPPQGEQQEAQAEERKEAVEEQQNEEKKAEQQASLENIVEVPAGRETGLNPKFKRKRNPWRGTPRATAKLRTAETRAGRGVGG